MPDVEIERPGGATAPSVQTPDARDRSRDLGDVETPFVGHAEAQRIAERHDAQNDERREERDDGSEAVEEPIGVRRNDILLPDRLESIGGGVEQTREADPHAVHAFARPDRVGRAAQDRGSQDGRTGTIREVPKRMTLRCPVKERSDDDGERVSSEARPEDAPGIPQALDPAVEAVFHAAGRDAPGDHEGGRPQR